MSQRNNGKRPAAAPGGGDIGDLLVGMKAICRHLNGVSEATALKFHRELGAPMRKSDKNGTEGVWLASRAKLDEWSQGLVGGEA